MLFPRGREPSVNIRGFARHTVSVASTQLCPWCVKAASPDSTWTEGCVPENFAVSTGLVALSSGDQKVACGARGEQAGGPVLPPTPGKSSADTASHLMMTVLGFV